MAQYAAECGISLSAQRYTGTGLGRALKSWVVSVRGALHNAQLADHRDREAQRICIGLKSAALSSLLDQARPLAGRVQLSADALHVGQELLASRACVFGTGETALIHLGGAVTCGVFTHSRGVPAATY